MAAKPHFNKLEEQLMIAAIEKASKVTSREIHVFIESNCPADDSYDRAVDLFDEQDLQDVENRNGVLIYMALLDRQFVIVGGEAINELKNLSFWDDTKTEMINHFKIGKMAKGLTAGIEHAGEKLSGFFPFKKKPARRPADCISFNY
jgi:uncharacterized membrane protein